MLLYFLLLFACTNVVAISNNSLACGAGDCQADGEVSESDTSFLQVRGAVRNTALEGITSRFVTGQEQPADKNSRVVMQMSVGCSGSSFIAMTVRDLINLHGVQAWMPAKELLAQWENITGMAGQTYCTDLNGKEHKWDRDGQQRLRSAWNVVS